MDDLDEYAIEPMPCDCCGEDSENLTGGLCGTCCSDEMARAQALEEGRVCCDCREPLDPGENYYCTQCRVDHWERRHDPYAPCCD